MPVPLYVADLARHPKLRLLKSGTGLTKGMVANGYIVTEKIEGKTLSLECCLPPKSLHYSDEELNSAFLRPMPRHVAIILDGNRRWMKKQFLHAHSSDCLGKVEPASPFSGHWAGAETLAKMVEAASDLGLKVLTVFGFSTENWGRTPAEVSALLQILQTYLDRNRQKMVEQGVRFNVIGNLAPFPSALKDTILQTCQATESGSGLDFVVALNYGGRDDICRAMQKIGSEIAAGRQDLESITEEIVSRFLDTAPFGDPDLLIRTSGEKRISNFLLWQLAYTEIYVTDTLWPDFTSRDLLKAVLDFQKRQRRIGK